MNGKSEVTLEPTADIGGRTGPFLFVLVSETRCWAVTDTWALARCLCSTLCCASPAALYRAHAAATGGVILRSVLEFACGAIHQGCVHARWRGVSIVGSVLWLRQSPAAGKVVDTIVRKAAADAGED